MDAAKLIFRSLAASVTYTLLTAIAGLAQLWAAIGLSYLKRGGHYNFSQMFTDGVLLFFAMAVVTSVALDYFFGESIKLPRSLVAILYYGCPLVTSFFVAFCYAGVYLLGPNGVDQDLVQIAQYFALSLAFLYSFVGRFLQFLPLGRSPL